MRRVDSLAELTPGLICSHCRVDPGVPLSYKQDPKLIDWFFILSPQPVVVRTTHLISSVDRSLH